MKPKTWGALGAGLAGLGMVAGAVGAHALKGLHERLGTASTWETASTYHFLHALALCVVALALRHRSHRLFEWSARLFFLGTLVFSGSLYLYSCGAGKWLAHVTPFGGFALIVGWVVFAIGWARIDRDG